MANSSQEHESYLTYSMSRVVEYRKTQKNPANQALLVSIPSDFAQAISLKKSDVLKIVLNGDKIIMEKA